MEKVFFIVTGTHASFVPIPFSLYEKKLKHLRDMSHTALPWSRGMQNETPGHCAKCHKEEVARVRYSSEKETLCCQRDNGDRQRPICHFKTTEDWQSPGGIGCNTVTWWKQQASAYRPGMKQHKYGC